ncbi:MAG: gamma-glutamylcyclotransferase [Pseudomonadota bacterium]
MTPPDSNQGHATMDEFPQRLFVYGTLAPGRKNHYVLAHVPGVWEAAALRGVLLEEGWGAIHGCPAIVPDEDGDLVEGHLFSSDRLAEHWSDLDEFEGVDYLREQVTVHLSDGSTTRAQVYTLRRRAGLNPTG